MEVQKATYLGESLPLVVDELFENAAVEQLKMLVGVSVGDEH